MISGHLDDRRRHRDLGRRRRCIDSIASRASTPASFPTLPHRDWRHVASQLRRLRELGAARRGARARDSNGARRRRAKGTRNDTRSTSTRSCEHLPHRYPFLLVDRVLECTPGKSIRGIKNVTINEPFFQGHFPGLSA